MYRKVTANKIMTMKFEFIFITYKNFKLIHKGNFNLFIHHLMNDNILLNNLNSLNFY